MRKYLLLLSIPLVIFSCRKDDKVEGPNIDDLLGQFAITEAFQADRDTVNFSTGEKVVFTASFNKLTDWEIHITGETSGAHRIISGQSREIDASNGTWIGGTTELPFFKAENCDIELIIPDITDTFPEAVEIRAPKSNEGFLISDFESGIFDAGWTKFIQSGADMDWNIKNDPALSPEKDHYLNMAGTVSWDYLIGLLDFNASAYGAPTFPLSTNGDNEYFNCLIYGEAGNNESIILFQFKEDENGDGTFNETNEDMYAWEIKVNWTGWKLMSIKYSDLTALENGQPVTPKGNGIHNPDKLGILSLLDLANPANGFASTKIDYLIFTPNQALNP